ncbi:hypothetical protein FXN61_25455 [Lentzea sp. PSKA42]|uniref:LemA protein n=1 Tax=Lentzea indica TaxID=2604800 RepID=A0ABX1FLU6_9PSEU|nr:hypothetical protein [Lentzea indica]NKE59964.1 hypothetical protein [Lentzea indica]
MGLVQVSITATATMLAVLIGGWLTLRAQDRLWRRDQDRQWRDIRLNTYTEFINAFREYVAFLLQADAHISAVPRPRAPGDAMPFFDETGTKYKERLESAKTSLRLVTEQAGLIRASSAMVHQARKLAASRATRSVDELPSAEFDALWAHEREFITHARTELGLSNALLLAGRDTPSRFPASDVLVKPANDVRREDV